tara:strand:+ start:2781 stop:3002 length:222 start_codon:yes stop_codon:yes gene_type:complete
MSIEFDFSSGGRLGNRIVDLYNWDSTNFDVSFSYNEYIYLLYTLKNKNIKFEYIELGSYPKNNVSNKRTYRKI